MRAGGCWPPDRVDAGRRSRGDPPRTPRVEAGQGLRSTDRTSRTTAIRVPPRGFDTARSDEVPPNELTDAELDEIDPEEFSNPNVVKQIRDHAKAQGATARTAQQERDAAIRENAFLKAGIDPSAALGKAFAAQVDGVPGDPVKLAADYLAFKAELGVTDPAPGGGGETTSTETGTEGTTTEGAADNGTASRMALSNGAEAPTAANPNARQAIRQSAMDAMRAGATFEEAAGGLVNATVLGWARDDIPSLVGDGVPAGR